MATEDAGNGREVDSATPSSSTQTGEEDKKKRYILDETIACMLGEKLDTFTVAFFKDDHSQASKVATPGCL